MARIDELMDAVRRDDAEDVTALLRAEPALAEAKDAAGVPVLLQALYMGRREAAAAIRAVRTSLDVHEAAAFGDIGQLRKRLDEDLMRANEYAADGFQPLGLAAFFGQPDAVKLLLSRGADVSAPSRNAQRVAPLHSAVAQGNAESVKALLEAGADPNARQQGGFTPLLVAAAKGQLENVKLLVSGGADPNGANDAGATPLVLARARKHAEIVSFLESKGAR